MFYAYICVKIVTEHLNMTDSKQNKCMFGIFAYLSIVFSIFTVPCRHATNAYPQLTFL